MAFTISVVLLFGFVAWLMTASRGDIVTTDRGAYDNILRVVQRRYASGDLERDEYERILRVLREGPVG